MPPDRLIRIKRMRMRSWRRGTKEMDLILGPYSDRQLEELNEAQLDVYETMLNENDHDLYRWYSGAARSPDEFAAVLQSVRHFHSAR